MKMILRVDYQFHKPWWDDVSEECKDLIRHMLVKDQDKR